MYTRWRHFTLWLLHEKRTLEVSQLSIPAQIFRSVHWEKFGYVLIIPWRIYVCVCVYRVEKKICELFEKFSNAEKPYDKFLPTFRRKKPPRLALFFGFCWPKVFWRIKYKHGILLHGISSAHHLILQSKCNTSLTWLLLYESARFSVVYVCTWEKK